MTEAQTIDWIVAVAENKAKNSAMSSLDKAIFEQRMKTMKTIKDKLKRVDYFGGVESLIQKASIVGQAETLFSE